MFPSRKIVRLENKLFETKGGLNKYMAQNLNEEKLKTVEFLKTICLEDLIFTRCNNLRAFYIETIRCFSAFEQMNQDDNATRMKLVYYFMLGMHIMETRNVDKIRELAESDDY